MNYGTDISPRGLLPAVFFVSFAAIGWQLVLMRCLLISRYHHFSFLVISCALLGFGAGGTVLALARSRIEGRADQVFRWGLFFFALSMPACFRIGEILPLNVYFPPTDLASTLGWWLVFWLIHLIPFLLAGILVGLSLMIAQERAHIIYGGNMAGSAAGALGAILLMGYLPANGLVVPFALSVLASGFFVVPRSPTRTKWLYSASLIAGGLVTASPFFVGTEKVFPLNVDQYKALAHVQRLVLQGDAQKERSLFGPRGRIDLFSSPHFHTLLSVSSTELPPRMDVLLRDGFQAGAIPRMEKAGDAHFLMDALAALPYKLMQPERVLILGESGGIYVQLARLSRARSIVFVQPDENVVRMLREHPTRVLDDPRIEVVTAEPRAFLDQNQRTFDIIHLAALEGFSPGSGGIGGLREDYLATVEGFTRCLAALAPGGLACTVRGIQDPPRDNIKIAATWIEALERMNVKDPGKRLLMARDELGMIALAAQSALDKGAVETFLNVTRGMSWDPEWFPGVRAEQTNKVHVLPGPAGTSISWYHYAMGELLSPDRDRFYKTWLWDIRPAADDRPFFFDFFRWASLSRLRAAFGPLWPARAEMGFLVLILSAVWTAIIAAILLPLPLVLFRGGTSQRPLRFTLVAMAYFGTLGTAFMFLEMSFIQIFTRFLGDPILAAALVLGGFLFFAGVGSVAQPNLTGRLRGGVITISVLIAFLVITDSLLFPLIFREGALLPDWAKIMVGLVIIAPLAILMGNPFPWGLALLHRLAPEVIPIAWAVNGFTSVVSASVAVILAMVFGFKALLGLAAGFYLCAGLLSVLLGRVKQAMQP